MQANLQDQSSLLSLAELDLELARNKANTKKLAESLEVESARGKLLSESDRLIDARNALGDLELQLKRAENDLELVERRLSQDQERLAKAQNQKDAEGLQHEIESLKLRKSELEDAEIGILDELEKQKQLVQEITNARNSAEAELEQIQLTQRSQEAELVNQATQLEAKRQQIVSSISPELVVSYEAKAKRGTAVGRLIGRDCGACNLSIMATVLDEISQLPQDQLPECPSCQAYLVRS